MNLNSIITLDWWDVIAVIAVVFIVVGMALWNWPSLLIMAGIGYLAFYYRRETSIVPENIASERSA